MTQYGKVSYWEERFKKDPEPFDWYQRYAGVRDILRQHIKEEDNILMVGCGNSRLSEEMFDDGFQKISNVDYSTVVIEQMKKKYEDEKYASMSWEVADITQYTKEEPLFDVAVDKGAMDSVLCAESSFDYVAKMLERISAALTEEGKYILISFGTPEQRNRFLDKPAVYGWTVEVLTVPKPHPAQTVSVVREGGESVHYIYICTKGKGNIKQDIKEESSDAKDTPAE